MNIRNTYFNYSGRIGRQTFWLVYILPVFFLAILLQLAVEGEPNLWIKIPAFVIHIVLMAGLFAGFSKRLHDRGKSALWILLALVPIIGFFYWVIDLGIFKGDVQANKYGMPPVQGIGDDGVIDA